MSIEKIFEMHRIDFKSLQHVKVEKLDERTLNEFEQECMPKQCYNNAYNLALTYDAKYVLCYSMQFGFPIEHAIIKLDGKYYDPTYQLFSKLHEHYYVVKEFDSDELWEMINKNNQIPMIHHIKP